MGRYNKPLFTTRKRRKVQASPADMKRVGLIGFPISHSLSPAIQNAAFAFHNRPERYELWETEASRLEATVRGLRDGDCLGANVTVPYKQAVIPWLDDMDALAREADAVNTIVNVDGRLSGYNTDTVGFAKALARAGFVVEGARAAVLGAGGAARAIGLVLVRGGAARIDLCDVVRERVEELAAHLRTLSQGKSEVQAHQPQDVPFRDAVASCRLLVNCTPSGTHGTPLAHESPVEANLIPSGAFVFDLVYNPAVTPLIAAARARGARAAGGLTMLVYQAAESFRLWTGLDAPVELMLLEAEKALNAS